MGNISKIDIFTLNLIKGIGQKSLMNLINSGYPITDLIAMDEDELGGYIKGSGKKNAIDTIQNHYHEQQENAERELDNLKENDIDLITFWDENGQIKSEKHYYYDGVTSKSVGTWIDWYKNGQIKKETYYYKGCRNGKWIEYYENGQTKSIEYYYTPYDPVVYKVGNWTYYNEDGTIDRFEEH